MIRMRLGSTCSPGPGWSSGEREDTASQLQKKISRRAAEPRSISRGSAPLRETVCCSARRQPRAGVHVDEVPVYERTRPLLLHLLLHHVKRVAAERGVGLRVARHGDLAVDACAGEIRGEQGEVDPGGNQAAVDRLVV